MHLRFIFLFTIGAVLVPPVVFAQEQNAPTLDELVAKNIEAKGGADALGALQSVKVTGKSLANEGQLQLGYTETKKRPGEVRPEATLQGITAVQAYDGNEGRRIAPSQ